MTERELQSQVEFNFDLNFKAIIYNTGNPLNSILFSPSKISTVHVDFIDSTGFIKIKLAICRYNILKIACPLVQKIKTIKAREIQQKNMCVRIYFFLK